MKLKYIYPLIIFLGLLLIPTKIKAASPTTTLTVDGVLIGSYGSAQEAVDMVTTTPGTNFVIEIASGTVTDPLNILQQTNKNVVIKPQPGAVVTFTNTITVDGNGNLNNPETLLIQGFIFDFTEGTYVNCIDFNLIPPRVGFAYPHNVTINGCTFKGIYDTTVAVQSIPGGLRNISIINSTATDMHSLAQLKAVSGYAFIQNCVVSNASGGVNFYGTGDLIVDSCNFAVEGYAVRSGQGAGVISNVGSVTVNNSILNSNSPTVGTIVLRGDSTSNINIIHSDINNADPSGASIQNLNAASEGLYNIRIVETNINGDISGIILTTITTIDDPNVLNGPIFININPNGSTYLLEILIVLFIILILPVLLFIIIEANRNRFSFT